MKPSSLNPASRRTRLVRALAGIALLTMQAAALAADPAPYWEGERSGPCDLQLRIDQGHLQVDAGRGRLRLDGSDAHWTNKAKATSADGMIVLDLTATTPEARLHLSLPARCKAHLSSGSGTITLNTTPARGLRAESLTGDIVLYVPRKADLAIDAATSGHLTVDFDLALDYLHHQEPSKRGHLRIGSGRVPVALESKRGAVRVLSEQRRTAGSGS